MRNYRNLLRVLVIVAVTVLTGTQCAWSQINTDWIEGVEKKTEKDWQNRRFQIGFELGAGLAKYEKEYQYYGDEDDEFMADAAIVLSYRVFRLGNPGAPQIEFSALGALGSNYTNTSGNEFRFLGNLGIEAGGRIPVSGSWVVRPFASFGPGISLFDQYFWTDDNVFWLWVARGGFEIQNNKSPVSYLIGGKMVFRDYDETGYFGSVEFSEDDLLGFLGVRFKI